MSWILDNEKSEHLISCIYIYVATQQFKDTKNRRPVLQWLQSPISTVALPGSAYIDSTRILKFIGHLEPNSVHSIFSLMVPVESSVLWPLFEQTNACMLGSPSNLFHHSLARRKKVQCTTV